MMHKLKEHNKTTANKHYLHFWHAENVYDNSPYDIWQMKPCYGNKLSTKLNCMSEIAQRQSDITLHQSESTLHHNQHTINPSILLKQIMLGN